MDIETHFERLDRVEKEQPDYAHTARIMRERLTSRSTIAAIDFTAAWKEVLPGVVELARLLHSMDIEGGEAAWAAKAFCRSWLYRKAIMSQGPQTYAPTEDLAKRLKETHIRNLTCADLHLPFPAIYVQVPRCLDFKIYDNSTGWHAVEGAYIVEEKSPRSWRVYVVGEAKAHAFDDATMDARVYLNDPVQSLDRALQEVCDMVDADNKLQDELGSAWVDDDKRKGWRDTVQWVAKVVLYATCQSARQVINKDVNPQRIHLTHLIKGSSKKKRRMMLADRRKDIPAWRRIILGETSTNTKMATACGLPLLTGHWVQGHFQRYHTKQAIILKWKEPYWQGPGDKQATPMPTERIIQ